MKRNTKSLLTALLLLAAACVVTIAIYACYVLFSFYRISDNLELEVKNNQEKTLSVGKEYSALTYNVGFGAYDHDFSFFLDTAEWKDSSSTTGKYGKAISRDHLIRNVEGQAEVLRENPADFILLQEVDTDSTRSYHINMVSYFEETFPFMSSTYAVNFHSPWLNLPIFDPIGIVNSGIVSLSRYGVSYAERRSYPIASDFSKLFDLDRCFMVQRIPVEGGRTLVLINSHMSAYDEGGIVRETQLKMLTDLMKKEYEKGNWVIVGGDFNHCLGKEYQDVYPSEQVVPCWAYILDNENLPDHFSLVKPTNGLEYATCRNADTPYIYGANYRTIVDGFIVSDNVEAESHVIDTDFLYSDHQPVMMKFTLR